MHPDQQGPHPATVPSGEPAGHGATSPVGAVYLNDRTAATIGYSLRTDEAAT